MSASFVDRLHAHAVELGMEAQALLTKLTNLDQREDDVRHRIHQGIHRLELIDKEEDAVIADLSSDLKELTGLLDSRQMRLGEVA
ncbi:MAG: hypothetical protein NUW01_00475 [Gemmatimonadaceae bacterium]|nr:hypothetical protein [Gemmatimonadaceae bacterium]